MGVGRKPKPTALKLITGNPGKRALPVGEPKLEPSEPSAPDFLNAEAKVEWKRVCHELYLAGVMTELDRGILAAYCQSYGLWERAEKALAKMAFADPDNFGLLMMTAAKNAINNPLIGIANKAKGDMARYASELGITPSSRTRVSTDSSVKKGNRFASNAVKSRA